jgi:Ca-activated chloride channel homolog
VKNFVLWLFLILALVGCSSKEETIADRSDKEKGKQEVEQKVETENILKEVENIQLEVSEELLLHTPPGSLMNELPYEEDIEEFSGPSEIDSKLKNEMEASLEELTSKTKDIEMIKKGLISLLASPHYKDVIEKANTYEPVFEEPYLPDPTKSESGEAKPASDKAIILLDASSSMLLTSGGKVKMDIAKSAVKSFAQTIGQSSDVSLVVYGHKGSEADADKGISCTGIEELYPMSKYSAQEFHQAVDSFESKGWTPLAGTIQKAADMSNSYNGTTTIYIVSDGAETCDGDPVGASKKLVQNNSGNTVNVIGFDVDGTTENQLKAVAEAGNGEYFKADTPEELKNTIQYEWLPSAGDLAWAFTLSPSPWRMMDEYKKAEEYPKQLYTIGRRESDRYIAASSIMIKNDWITLEQHSELQEWSYERQEQINKIHQELYKRNKEKADTKNAEIDQRVDEWVEKMKELRKQSGEVW